LKTLARERPLPNIFNLYTLISVLGQFAVHLTALIYVVNEAHKRIPPKSDEFADLEAEFTPNLVNSCVYIMSVTLQIATFAVNYQVRNFTIKFQFLFFVIRVIHLWKVFVRINHFFIVSYFHFHSL
jgi:cation-transporting ATPase 13A1